MLRVNQNVFRMTTYLHPVNKATQRYLKWLRNYTYSKFTINSNISSGSTKKQQPTNHIS